MPTRLRSLKSEARRVARAHEHKLSRFHEVDTDRAAAHCERCGGDAEVDAGAEPDSALAVTGSTIGTGTICEGH